MSSLWRVALGGVACGVAYGSLNAHFPAVLSVPVVRLGQMGGFQDRSDRPLRHLSAVEFVLNLRRVTQAWPFAPGLGAQVWPFAPGLGAQVWLTG